MKKIDIKRDIEVEAFENGIVCIDTCLEGGYVDEVVVADTDSCQPFHTLISRYTKLYS